jgi:hypothetical protein
MQVNEKNYYSGQNSIQPFVIEQHGVVHLPHPPSIPGLINGLLVALEVDFRLRHLQKLVADACSAYSRKEPIEYFYTIEAILLSMRRVLDDLVMIAYCRENEQEILSTRKISVDGFGSLFKNGNPTCFGKKFLDSYVQENKEFASILIELSNSFKHSYLLAESRQWGADFPTVLSIYAPRNDYSGNVTYHNHSLGQLVIGFNQLVESIKNKLKNCQ